MNDQTHHPALPPRRTAAFTLIELMVVVSIIAILAGISMGALNSARQTARVKRTQALIAKLHQVIMQRWESFETRRAPISTSGMAPAQATEARQKALWDLMRMEMPERWSDVTTDPVTFSYGGVQLVISRPALSYLYAQQYQAALARSDPETVGKFGPAECLYMIIITSCSDEMGLFTQSEVGDADGDGLLEFHDGWDRPIMFLRWAPGFTGASVELTPLIYSGGVDLEYGIELNEDYNYEGKPYASGAGAADGTKHDVDNIHNHRIEAR